jgi:type 1 glutamine amidotransferase
MGKNILMVLGGTWHDFEGFATDLTPLLESAGHCVTPTFELEAVTKLDVAGYDLVLLNTCVGANREDSRPSPAGFTQTQAQSLSRWVRAGGAVLALHAATVAGQSRPEIRTLLGGVFVSHPPPFSFTIYPLSREHPISAGIAAFSVYDELYIQDYAPSVEIHLVALDRGTAHPMAWSKSEGKGHVAYIAVGHSQKVWRLLSYQQLILQAIDWLTERA